MTTTVRPEPGTRPDPWPDALSRARFHVVSGKGGTGKTTVAAALALALAGGGKRVLLVEVEGRQGIAQVFDTAPLPYEERRIAVAPGGGEVRALAVDADGSSLLVATPAGAGPLAGAVLRIDTLGRPAPGNPDRASPVLAHGLTAPGGVCVDPAARTRSAPGARGSRRRWPRDFSRSSKRE